MIMGKHTDPTPRQPAPAGSPSPDAVYQGRHRAQDFTPTDKVDLGQAAREARNGRD
jgi:hypothetical protein